MVEKQSNWHPAFSTQPHTVFLQKIGCFQTKLLSKPASCFKNFLHAFKPLCAFWWKSYAFHDIDWTWNQSSFQTLFWDPSFIQCQGSGKSPPRYKPARSTLVMTLYTSPSTAETMSFDIKRGKSSWQWTSEMPSESSVQFFICHCVITSQFGGQEMGWWPSLISVLTFSLWTVFSLHLMTCSFNDLLPSTPSLYLVFLCDLRHMLNRIIIFTYLTKVVGNLMHQLAL